MLAAFLALLIALFPATLRPAGDEDGDGVANLRETIHGCDAFDAASRPYCLPGAEVPGSCSSSIPGAELEPCQ